MLEILFDICLLTYLPIVSEMAPYLHTKISLILFNATYDGCATIYLSPRLLAVSSFHTTYGASLNARVWKLSHYLPDKVLEAEMLDKALCIF